MFVFQGESAILASNRGLNSETAATKNVWTSVLGYTGLNCRLFYHFSTENALEERDRNRSVNHFGYRVFDQVQLKA